MSWKVQIIKAKPNPYGKDRTYGGSAKHEKLLGEWVDLKNIGDDSVNLSVLNLCHTEFSGNCVPNEKPSIYWTGPTGKYLQPQEIVRVHTGYSQYSHLMSSEDRSGVHYHAYAERGNFVLNNDCGDLISVWWKDRSGNWQQEDKAGYSPNPPEGAVLIRSGNLLVPETTASYRGY